MDSFSKFLSDFMYEVLNYFVLGLICILLIIFPYLVENYEVILSFLSDNNEVLSSPLAYSIYFALVFLTGAFFNAAFIHVRKILIIEKLQKKWQKLMQPGIE